MICGECKYHVKDWTNKNNPDRYCNCEISENYGYHTEYEDGCEDGEEYE